jgi:hypothetical protein
MLAHPRNANLCNDANPFKRPVNAMLMQNLSPLSESIARAIQYVRRHLDSFGSGVPILLLNGVTHKGVDG